jgi:hypothetical protein
MSCEGGGVESKTFVADLQNFIMSGRPCPDGQLSSAKRDVAEARRTVERRGDSSRRSEPADVIQKMLKGLSTHLFKP